MRHHFILLCTLIQLGLAAQNGPAGVGSAANNVLWLRADNGVNQTGGFVDTWNDRSGNNNHAAFAVGQPGQRPAVIAGSQNGYPTIDFDGIDDQLLVPDQNNLDLTGWDFFIVNAVDAAKSNNVWFSKGSSTQCNYGLWSTATNALQLPIYDIWTLFSAPTTMANVTSPAFTLEQYTNNVIFGLFPARTVYRNGVSIHSDVNLLQLPQTNNQPLRIGNASGSVGWNLDGDIAEVIMFNNRVNTAHRYLIANYLAAKYGIALGANEIYQMDNGVNGDYDHDVAGIGRADANNLQIDSRGTGIVRIYNATSLGNNEFMMWGHDNDIMGTWGSVDLPPGIQGRWYRTWRVSEVNATGSTAVDVGTVTMEFDLTGITPITTSDIRLLVDTDNDGVFADETPIGPPTAVGGNIYRFTGVTQLANARRFTLGTIDTYQTPLPVELVRFDAEAVPPTGIELTWSTATEMDNDHFLVQRSSDLLEWLPIGLVDGQGTILQPTDYSFWDKEPLDGASYYRLVQVDHNGEQERSSVRGVTWSQVSAPRVMPNPSNGRFALRLEPALPSMVQMVDASGRVVWSSRTPMTGMVTMDLGHLPAGTYTAIIGNDRAHRTERVVIER
ncbi:MAG: T9SS type A sorting domain-containing protein [Flavobacteriales bacterium]|nr:T9SS type A sorting domain-containing protein [Flavobacteriales bacterium]